jgi:MoxR-like ATPase
VSGIGFTDQTEIDNRFLIKTSLGYPDHDTAVTLLLDSANRARAAKVSPIIAASSVTTMAQLASEVFVDAAVLGYLNQIV